MCCLLIFFFQQKTAYEMRISDWSSDVCTSDLLIRSKQRPFRRFVERLALRCMDHPSLRRLLAAKIRRIDDLDSLGEALGRPRTILCLGNGPSSEDPAIGRGSCRARM